MNWDEYEERYGESREDHLETIPCPTCGGEGCMWCDDLGYVELIQEDDEEYYTEA